MIKLTVKGQNAYFAVAAIRSVTRAPHADATIFKSLVVVGDTEDCMFYVDQTPDEVFALLPEGYNL